MKRKTRRELIEVAGRTPTPYPRNDPRTNVIRKMVVAARNDDGIVLDRHEVRILYRAALGGKV